MKRSVPRVQGKARMVAKGELIGRGVTIASSTDPGLAGLVGTVVDESLRTLTIRLGPAGARRMQVSKVGCVFRFETKEGPVEIDGRAIEFRPEDRTKKVR